MQTKQQTESSEKNVGLNIKSPKPSSNLTSKGPTDENLLAQQLKPQRPKIRLARKPGEPTVARKAIDYYAESHPVEVTKATEFVPGEVRGTLLREALGLEGSDPGGDVEWLKNMMQWGYPPGWTGAADPIKAMKHRIEHGIADDYDDAGFFRIVDGEGMGEEVD